MTKICIICNKELVKRKTESMTRFLNRQTCSRECSLKKTHDDNIGHSMNKGKDPPNKGKKMSSDFREKCRIRAKKERVEKIIVKCEFCSKEKRLTPNKAKWRKHHFCNRECKGKWDSVNKVGLMAGPKHPLFGTKRPQHVKDAASIANLGMSTWNKGKTGLQHHSDETKQRISSALKEVPKSEEHKVSQSLSKKGEKNPQYGHPPWSYGISLSTETIQKIKLARRLQKMESSKPEKDVQQELQRMGIEFEHNLLNKGQTDIFIAPNKHIFIDSDFHHANPKEFKPDQRVIGIKIAKDIWNYDFEITELRQKEGNEVYRFWVTEINKNISKCINIILSGQYTTIKRRDGTKEIRHIETGELVKITE